MFYSVNEFYDFLQDPASRNYNHYVRLSSASKRNLAKLLSRIKRGIVERNIHVSSVLDGTNYGSSYESIFYLGKFLRPWHVVPKLRNMRAPEGDFTVGVEVEMGFDTVESASALVSKIRNWKWVAIDHEGSARDDDGITSYGVETTFAPVLYSKMSKNAQAFRYLRLLANHSGVFAHAPGACVGTHVNVGPPNGHFDSGRLSEVAEVIEERLSWERCLKYFGREYPYGCGRARGHYIEYKLFNSVTDWKILRRYVDIAVSLTKLICSDEEINEASVVAACEAGYNKNERN